MRVHVVFAHPSSASFAGAVRDRVVRALIARGHEVDELDLYAAGFDPVLTPGEWTAHVQGGANLAGIGPEVERLRKADALVLVFPTWWFGMPAILKGWFDRVWAPGVAFHLPPRGGPLRRGLTNIRSFAVVTTHGSPWWVIALGLGNPGKTVLMRGIAPLLAPGAAIRFLALYDMDRAGRPRLERFLEGVERAFRSFA
ncbi:MAG: dehydrogenase [Caulobacteraceae bacterium]|jgi:NAD(P)H dehydrogenase (quinone)|nr:dehydrogenase [Caulobacteraceae bacterium]